MMMDIQAALDAEAGRFVTIASNNGEFDVSNPTVVDHLVTQAEVVLGPEVARWRMMPDSIRYEMAFKAACSA